MEKTEIAKTLLEACQDDKELLGFLLAPNKSGCTPLHLAGSNGACETAKVLLNFCQEDRELLRLLLAPDNNGGTPLYLAACLGSFERAEALLNFCQKDKELLGLLLPPDNNGYTALNVAAGYGKFQIAELIIEVCQGENKSLLDQLFSPARTPFTEALCFRHLNLLDLFARKVPDELPSYLKVRVQNAREGVEG